MDVTPDPVLFSELQKVVASSRLPGGLSLSQERVMDFFICMAICNTVVLSHDDKEKSGKTSLVSRSRLAPLSHILGFFQSFCGR